MLGKCKGDLKLKFEQIKSQFNIAFRKHFILQKKKTFLKKNQTFDKIQKILLKNSKLNYL